VQPDGVNLCYFKPRLGFALTLLPNKKNLWFLYLYIFTTQFHRPSIFLTINNLSLKYQRFTPSGCKDICVKKGVIGRDYITFRRFFRLNWCISKCKMSTFMDHQNCSIFNNNKIIKRAMIQEMLVNRIYYYYYVYLLFLPFSPH